MKTTVITLPTSRPRNPCVAASRRRKAGPHRRAAGGVRRQARVALQRELERPQSSP
jgi:hypothetical protein